MKVEVSVLPNGLDIGCSKFFPGSVRDFEIIQRGITWHRIVTNKKETESILLDIGMYHGRYPNNWAIFADKGHQGLSELSRAILPINKPPRGVLGVSDELFNRKV